METTFFQTSVISSSLKAVDFLEAYTDLRQFCGDEGGWHGAVGTSGAFNYWAAVVSIRQGAVGTSGAFSYWATVVSIKVLSHGVWLGRERVEVTHKKYLLQTNGDLNSLKATF